MTAHGHDHPAAPRRTIYTQSDWDRAAADGTLAVDDIAERLRRIVVHELDLEGPAGYNDDGFFMSLTADGLRLEGNVTAHVWPNDHPPPHIHIVRPGLPGFKIDLVTGDPIGRPPRDVSSKQLKRIKAKVLENAHTFGSWWTKNQGARV